MPNAGPANVIRMPGQFKPFHVHSMFEYVSVDGQDDGEGKKPDLRQALACGPPIADPGAQICNRHRPTMEFPDPAEPWGFAAAALLCVNLFAFGAFAWDKAAARRGAWRIRESTLLGLALAGGIFGALAGQRLLRHKTRKEPFRTQLYSIAGLQAAIALLLAVPQSRTWIFETVARAAG